ncbi:CLUMA_CG014173, isoform A [Clunio marinus]|uniref:CLUMA_CG014173, isoform A n=1 Tax=Clunio marinus TaxID=568069 RepID=A0A1J1IQ24_9DIPT|nr:CLUMA_CG014173, isoform A [Clunio marinus]
MTSTKLNVNDPEFVDKIIYEVKSEGHFDTFRKECLADVDTQPAYQNLHSRVEDSVQKFLNRQVWTPETNKNRLREDMRYNIIRAGYLETGVTRIVDQVVAQKMDYIKSKVEEILYQYVGIDKPIKKEKDSNGALEVETDLLPTDLEQVSPDSDKKSDDIDEQESKEEEIEEEIVEDEDFESPAFEPIEAIITEKNDSNLSGISGLTSQDSAGTKNQETENQDQSQERSIEQMTAECEVSKEIEEPHTPIPGVDDDEDKAEEETATIPTESIGKEEIKVKEETEKSQFDLQKESIEFTGTERKSMIIEDAKEDSNNSDEIFVAKEKSPEKALQPQDVPSNTMEIDNLYENDTTDSSEMRMEIDLKDDTTQETGGSASKVEESSQDSTVPKETQTTEEKRESHHHHKRNKSKERHKSSSHSHKSSRHHHSSSSKSRHDDKHKSKSSSHKSSSSSNHKKSSSEKERSSSSRRDDRHDKDKKSSKHREHKTIDDHHQEKTSRRRRSTDNDSNDGKGGQGKSGNSGENISPSQSKTESNSQSAVDQSESNQVSNDNKPLIVDKMLSENCEMSLEQKTSSKKEQKSSILVKYDYLKPSSMKTLSTDEEIDEDCLGFVPENLPDNHWFESFRYEAAKKPVKRLKSNKNNHVDQKKIEEALNLKIPKRLKSKTLDSPDSSAGLMNGNDETSESRAQLIAQQQRYPTEDLYKPRFDFGNRSRRRGQVTEENSEDSKEEKKPVEIVPS